MSQQVNKPLSYEEVPTFEEPASKTKTKTQ